MEPSTIYLVSGANRGLGLGFINQILTNNPTAFVYAGARNPDAAVSLHKLQEVYPTRLTILKLISADVAGNKEAVQLIEKTHGKIDTVIANAAIAHAFGRVDSVDPAGVDEHFHVNVTGTIVLFQAVFPLLKKSASPRFIPISSSGGRLSGPVIEMNFGSVAYTSSKAALNWVARKIHFENEWLTAFPVCPGAVNTDMLDVTLQHDDQKAFPMSTSDGLPTPDIAAAGLLKIIDKSTRQGEGGQFIFVTGERIDW